MSRIANTRPWARTWSWTLPLCLLAWACRAGNSDGPLDPIDPHGNGLPARVLTDAALWPDVGIATPGPSDGSTRPDRTPSSSDAASDLGSPASSPDGAPAPPVTCSLLDSHCPLQQGCYPDEFLSGATACLPATVGIVLERFPCQVQTDCAAGEICFVARGTGQVCLQLCRTDVPAGSCLDLLSTSCVPLPHYPGVGYCL